MAKRKRNSSNSSDEDMSEPKPSAVTSGSSSSSDEEDVDWNAKTSNKPKTKRGRPSKKSNKASHESVDEEKEEGEVEDDEEEDEDLEEFNDGYDENLMGDEDDQKRLSLMTEKEREQELFNRSEKREVLKTRFEIERKLRMAKKKELNKSQTDASARSTERRRNMEEKRKVKDAIKGLKAEREKKKEKLKQQRLRAADVYSSDSDSDDDKNVRRKSSSSSSSTSSSSDDSDNENVKHSRNDDNNNSNKKDEDDWDENHASDKEEAETWSITVEHLNSIRLSRYKMEKWCHSPFFKETVTGCFVRIGIGLNPKSNKSIYRVAQIVDVIETPKIYNLGKTRTNKGIKLRYARAQERVYRLEFVSNTEIEPNEFNQWFESMTNDRCEFPSKDFVERKKKDIANALNYSYSDNDIESIVQEKERFNNRPVNYAMKKTKLLKDKELAEINGDHDKVEKIMQEIDELESEAKLLDKRRTQNIAAISYINERNRMRNIKEAEKALVEQSAISKALNNSQDPFTRRKCTPTMIHMFNKHKLMNSKDGNDYELVANDVNNQIESNVKNECIDENNKDLSAIDSSNGDFDQKPSIAYEKVSSPGSSTGQQNDLFSAHNFDIKIDFDVDIGIPSASSANTFSHNSLTTHNNSFNSPKTTNRRSLNLDEYKKKKGLI